MKYHITITDNDNSEVVADCNTNAFVGSVADDDGGCNCIILVENDGNAFIAAVIGAIEAAAIAVEDNGADKAKAKEIVYKTFINRIDISEEKKGGEEDE